MITYNDIYEAARKERYSEQLQAIPKNFISEVAIYLKEKKEIALKNDDFSDSFMKTKKQLENAITLFNELMLRRKRKIMNLVLIASETGIAKQDFENMFAFEKNLFENLIKCLESSQRNFNEILHGKQEETQKNELIVFKENVEEFVDFNGEKMGGFEKGQIANIPKEISKILIADGKAEVVGK